MRKILSYAFKMLWVCLALVFMSHAFACMPSKAEENAQIDEESVDERIYAGLLEYSDSIYLLDLDVQTDELYSAVTRVMKSNWDLYHVGSSFSYTSDKQGRVVSLDPTYVMSKEERVYANDLCANGLGKILFYMPQGLSNVEICLYLHDHIIENFEYDTALESKDMYSMLKYKRGTCQGYTYLYAALLCMCGIRSDVAYSDTVNHMWNIVCIDDTWYHIDVTWDDKGDRLGYVSHENFLRSYNEMEELGHADIKTYGIFDHADKGYFDGHLCDVDTSFAYFQGKWYFTDNHAASRSLRALDIDTGNTQKILDITGYWSKSEEGRFYANSFSSVISVGNSLYYNLKDRIYRYDGHSLEEIYASADELYCLAFKDGYIVSSDVSGSIRNVLSPSPTGDSDGDGVLGVGDLVSLLLYIEKGGGISAYECDMDRDGRLTQLDADIIRKRLLQKNAD